VGRLPVEAEGDGPVLGFVHGFTQTRRSAAGLRARLATARRVVAVDLPGHGDAGRVRADLPTTAARLGATVGRAAYLGYSLGGRVLLHLAVARPDLVTAAVLVGANPGIDDPEERHRRRLTDEALAGRLDGPGAPFSPEERARFESFLASWCTGPLFRRQRLDAGELAARRANTTAGLAASLRDAGTGTQASLWERLGDLPMPVLVVAGAEDPKFCRIAEEMVRRIPQAELLVVPEADHAVPLEAPEVLATATLRFLSRHEPSPDSTPRPPGC
jgi:2-succinyl-6-hydroxy-2,4-cyclohexadiene-1-carboxylate synthase